MRVLFRSIMFGATLSCLLFCPIWAGLVSISDTLKKPDGTNFTGRIQVVLNSPGQAQPLLNGDGQTLTGFQRSILVSNGVFSLSLEANDTITPAGTSYSARYAPSVGGSWFETWVIPTSSTPLPISAIRSTTRPIPAVMVSPAQISQGTANIGQALVWNGSSWTPTTTGAGTVYTATAVIDAIATPDGTCVLDSTGVTVTGAALGGRPTIGSSFQPPEGVTITAKVTGPNTMKIEICNHSGASYDPSSATYYFGVTQ